MLQRIDSIVSNGEYGEFGSLWMMWNWIHVGGGEYVLNIRVEGFQQDEERTQLTDEEEANAMPSTAWAATRTTTTGILMAILKS